MAKRKRIGKILVGLALAPILLIALANLTVNQAASGKVYNRVQDVPQREVALVLGTTPKVFGQKNLFFERRLDAAAKLYKAGKVRCLLVSGDHGTRYYNEVAAMRKGLIQRGIPAGRIAEDHAGFRTLDSVIRAKEVFGAQKVTIVSDGFHLPRSLYLAQHEGIDAVGFASVEVPTRIAPKPALREVAARVLLFADLYVLHRGPKFLGPRESLPL